MSSLIRLYPACYKGDIQAINAGSLAVHINLQYKKWKEAGKMVEDNHAHQTQIYKKKVQQIKKIPVPPGYRYTKWFLCLIMIGLKILERLGSGTAQSCKCL